MMALRLGRAGPFFFVGSGFSHYQIVGPFEWGAVHTALLRRDSFRLDSGSHDGSPWSNDRLFIGTAGEVPDMQIGDSRKDDHRARLIRSHLGTFSYRRIFDARLASVTRSLDFQAKG